MKKVFLIVVVGIISGIGGAWLYENHLSRNIDAVEGIPVSNDDFLDRNSITNAVAGPANDVEDVPYTESNRASQMLRPADFTLASKSSTKSVVFIKTISQNRYRSTWMDWFFGEGAGQRSISTGSGVIYRKDGYIITNNHVVNDADRIEVIIGKKEYEAALVGADASTDLAVLKVSSGRLPEIRIGSSRNVEVGEWVLAVGNPFNLTSTVTAGIVSAKGRELNIMKSIFPIESFIQTDAAINPGNSGGALVNLEGELIGINTAILSKTGSYAGYGFAVPSDIVKKVADDIIKYGEVQKAFFGADVLDIDSDIAEKLGTDDYSGVVISYVEEDGAASKIGINKGDIILKLDNEAINSRSQFEEVLSYHSPGDRLNVTFKRNKKIINNTLVLTNREGTTELLEREIFTFKSLGADFEKVSKVERNLLNIEHGVRVIKVRNGLISQMEIDEGFIITYINKVPIKDPETLADILTKIRGRVYLEGINKRGRREIYRYYF
ncbi:MAG: trypsin-like peptidase domain-containing protein [Cytophagales bacterium]|nr:trypsin-like peptidase domain-containing protein [Cytophagales bacterium]